MSAIIASMLCKMWVNTKYLDEMGVDVPQTTQEFYDVCKKFVETYPDKIAIGGASSGWYVDSLHG